MLDRSRFFMEWEGDGQIGRNGYNITWSNMEEGECPLKIRGRVEENGVPDIICVDCGALDHRDAERKKERTWKLTDRR
mgnify:CR=1 FL=1